MARTVYFIPLIFAIMEAFLVSASFFRASSSIPRCSWYFDLAALLSLVRRTGAAAPFWVRSEIASCKKKKPSAMLSYLGACWPCRSSLVYSSGNKWSSNCSGLQGGG